MTDTEAYRTTLARLESEQVKADAMSEKRKAAIAAISELIDAADQGADRSRKLFDLFSETAKRLDVPTHATIGNHDVYGTGPKAGVSASDPLRGKKLFEDRQGKALYHSYDHKGWHFVLLDSIGVTAERGFVGLIDAEQIDWLKRDLARVGKTRPVVLLTHVPLLSSVLQIVPDPWKTAPTYLVTTASEVLEVLRPYNVKAVLQGHTHICETVIYNGCQFITSGAVSGNWWKGPRAGHPEGFGVLTVKGDQLSWRYETY